MQSAPDYTALDIDGPPIFLRVAQAEARERFEASAVPHGKDENWRFGNLSAFKFTEAPTVTKATKDEASRAVARSVGVEHVTGKAIFVNGKVEAGSTWQLSEELRAKGVIWTSIGDASLLHPELFQRYFHVQGAPLGGERFAALHMAMWPTGTFLYVPKNVEIALPLECYQWHTAGAVYPHTLIVAERHSKVTFLDYQRSLDSAASGYAGAVTDLHVGEGAIVNYVCFQQWGSGVVANQINSTEVGRDGAAKSLTLNLGGSAVRAEHFSRMTGAGGRSDMLCISAAEGSQTFDMRTLQEHQAPNTASDLLYKNTLNGRSRTVFSGLIKVDPGAQGTDAYQTVRNLLLDEAAEADSMPGLEILADEVKCSHGATTGQIDAEELFYMQARGIPTDVAKRLVVYGFLQEVAQRLHLPEVETHIAALVAEHFAALR